MKKLLIVGGGAAGYFAAINAAELNPELDVIFNQVIDNSPAEKLKNQRLLAKSAGDKKQINEKTTNSWRKSSRIFCSH